MFAHHRSKFIWLMTTHKLRKRRGAAVVEAAITLPVIFIIILGTVEVCNGIFMRQSLKLMAFEGARITIVPEASFEDVEQQVEEIATVRNVKIKSVEVKPANFQDEPPGNFIEVVVTAAPDQPGKSNLFLSSELSQSVFIMKEQ